MKKTTIVGINAFIIALLLFILIYPLKPEINLKEKEVRLRWMALYKNYTIYIDDNKEFTSPIEIKTERKDYPLELEPGIYFWKVSHKKISSPVKKLTLLSDVSIRVRNDSLENDGNVDLNISLESVTGAIAADLPYKDKIKLEDRNYNITARQK